MEFLRNGWNSEGMYGIHKKWLECLLNAWKSCDIHGYPMSAAKSDGPWATFWRAPKGEALLAAQVCPTK